MTSIANPQDTAYMERGACRKEDPRLFDTPKDRNGKTSRKGDVQVRGEVMSRPKAIIMARAVCAACPVNSDCLKYVKKHPEPYGIWGGLLPEERA